MSLLLMGCAIAPVADDPLVEIEAYNRKDWKHWVDADGDCQDTRQEVLIQESEVDVTFTDSKHCRVATGQWTDAYTGEVFTDPSLLDVDHVIALRDAHDSGGYTWDPASRQAFANNLDDPTHLRAVGASANRSKGSRGPDEWLPPLAEFRCQYVREWIGLKATWDLTMSTCEQERTDYILRVCDAGQIPPLPQGKR